MMTVYHSTTTNLRSQTSVEKEHGRQQKCDTVGPTGRVMSIRDLPPPGTNRWVPRRKAELVAGVRGGLLTLEQACEKYSLSIDEFRSWERLLGRFGVPGLRTTRTKNYRDFEG